MKTASRLFPSLALLLVAGACDVPPNDPLAVNYCEEGYVWIPSSTCVRLEDIFIHGLVRITGNAEPIEGATITYSPAGVAPAAPDVSQITATTDVNGYFFMRGLPGIDNASLVISKEGFDTQIIINISANSSLGGYYYYANISLVPSGVKGRVAGTVYAGDTPAATATVELRRGGGIERSVTTGTDGRFAFDNLPLRNNYDVRVQPFDEDRDNIIDYQATTVSLGVLESIAAGANYSNLVIGLTPVQRALLWANFIGWNNTITGSTTIGGSGFRFVNPTDNIVLHFGAEVDVLSAVFELYPYETGGGYGTAIPVTPLWNPSNTVATLDPSTDLTADSDPDTLYELRITTLLWADGRVLIAQNTPGTYVAIRFDVSTAATFLQSPTPQLYIGNRVSNSQTGQTVSCDAKVCWILDGEDYIFNGYADPFVTGSSSLAYFNQNSGVQLVVPRVEGAASYNVYARQRNDHNDSYNRANWYLWGSAPAGFTDPSLNVVYIGGALNGTGTGSWGFFDQTGFGGSTGGPLMFGTELDIVVTAVSAEGFESALDPTRALTLSDAHASSLRGVEYDYDGNNGPLDATTETGPFGVKKVFRLYFSEFMDVTVAPTVAALSGYITSFVQGNTVSWGDNNITPQNAIDNVTVGANMLNFRGACARVSCDATVANDSDELCVDQTTPFGSGAIVVLDAGGGSLSHATELTITSVNSNDRLVAFSTTLTGDINTGDWACATAPGAGNGTTVRTTTAGGEVDIDVNDASVFFAGQQIVFYDQNTGNAHFTTVQQVRDTTADEITVAAAVPVLTATSTVVFARPSGTEIALRNASRPDVRNATTASGGNLRLELTASLANTNVIRGDAVMFDLDGELLTADDRYFGTVSQVIMGGDDPNSGPVDTNDFAVLVTAPTLAGMPGLPDGSVVTPGYTTTSGRTLVMFLGDSFVVTNAAAAGATPLRDSSGNLGLDGFRDQFGPCSATPGCAAIAGSNALIY